MVSTAATVKTQQVTSEVVRTRVAPLPDEVYLETLGSQAGIGSFEEYPGVLREGMIEVVFPVSPDDSLEFPDYPLVGTLGSCKAESGRAMERLVEGGTMKEVSRMEGATRG